jgi:hypothetical protein
MPSRGEFAAGFRPPSPPVLFRRTFPYSAGVARARDEGPYQHSYRLAQTAANLLVITRLEVR